jgi:uncharacterized lipoprotein YddW (UPF0748 family)
MKRMLAFVVLMGLLGCAGNLAWADESGVLEVRGPDAAEKGYPIGKVEFLDVALADQLVHIADRQVIPLRLSVKYKVLKTSPVILNSRFGTEYWKLYNYTDDTWTPVYTRERIDLATEGTFVTSVDQAIAGEKYGSPLTKGLVGIFGHYYFLIDQEDGDWLDVVGAPLFFSAPEVIGKLYFTLADLSDFKLSFDEIQSTWQPGGPLRVKLNVTDADGQVFPVVNVPATVSAGDWQTSLQSQTDWLHTRTDWLIAELPSDRVPEQVAVTATVRAMTPGGPVQRQVRAAFDRGEGQASAAEIGTTPPEIELPRNEDGKVRETRALWVTTKTLRTRETIADVVDRAAAARMNVLVPNIFYHNRLAAKSSRAMMATGVEEGLDPLAELIEIAHDKGIEVHPWFCVSYGPGDVEATRPEWVAVDKDGEFVPYVNDLHSLEYQQYFVHLAVAIARNYDIDGIHLDYIRTKGYCYCERCRQGFQALFDKPLTEATEQDWVAWNRTALGNIVRRVARGVRRFKPDAMISAAVFVNLESGARQGQDPAGWARQGWVDLVMPMDYDMSSLRVRANENRFLGIMHDDDKLVSGLCMYQRTGAGAVPRPPWLVKEQIQLVRTLGIHGYCLFCDTYLSPEIIEMLSTELSQEPAVPYFR